MANDPLNLDESAEWAGLWWLPEDPDERMPGVLRYEPENGLVLSLIGVFEDRVMSNPTLGVVMVHEGRRTWDVIHGAAEHREITLLGCVPIGGKRTIGARVKSPDKQTVMATTALIGAHVSGEKDAAFSAAEVSVEDLGLWAASSVFEGYLGVADGKPDGSGSISVKPPETQSIVVDGTEFRPSHRHTLPFFDQRRGRDRRPHARHRVRANRPYGPVLPEWRTGLGQPGARFDRSRDAPCRGRNLVAARTGRSGLCTRR